MLFGAWIILLGLLTAAAIGIAHAAAVLVRATTPQPIEARLYRCAKCRYPVNPRFMSGDRCSECGTPLSGSSVLAPGEGTGATPSCDRTHAALSRFLFLTATVLFLAIFLLTPSSFFYHRIGSSEYTPKFKGWPAGPAHGYRPRVEIDYRGEVGRPASSGVIKVELRANDGRAAAFTLDAASGVVSSATVAGIAVGSPFRPELVDTLLAVVGLGTDDPDLRVHANLLAAIVAGTLHDPGQLGQMSEELGAGSIDSPCLSRTGGGFSTSTSSRIRRIGPFALSDYQIAVVLLTLVVAFRCVLHAPLLRRYQRARDQESIPGADRSPRNS